MASVVFKPDSLSIMQVVGQPDVADWKIEDPTGSLSFNIGQPVTFTDNTQIIFGGTIEEASFAVHAPDALGVFGAAPSTTVRTWSLKALGYQKIAEKWRSGYTVWASTFSQPYLISDIANALGAILAIDGISLNVFVDGTLIVDRFQTDNETVAESLERLKNKATQMSGVQYLWNITPGKVLNFFPVTTFVTHATLGPSYGYPPRANTASLRQTREQFANVVMLKLSRGVTSETTDTFSGDGISQTFVLSHSMASPPQVTVNGSSQTVGIDGVDINADGTDNPSFQWYWNGGSGAIRQNSFSSPLGSGDSLAVKYIGQDIRGVVVSDPVSIARQAAIEGNSGEYVAVVEAGDATNSSQVLQLANTELVRRSTIPSVFRCQVFAPGNTYVPGMLVQVSLTGYGINNTTLIGYMFLRSVRVFDEKGTILWRELELFSTLGVIFTGTQFLRRLAS